MKNKIVPSLWFNADGGSLTNIISYYQTIFTEAFEPGQIMALGETPSGKTEMCNVTLYGQRYAFMCTASMHHPLNDAVSFMLNCENQNEIDKFWNYFTHEGKETQCGWCIDKYGLRWQVLPNNLGQLMQKPNAFQVMMSQKKIVIEEYL